MSQMSQMAQKPDQQPSDIDSVEFDEIIHPMREFCRNQGMKEACVQQRRSILAACEDPETISTYNHGGQVWPLPQTGQMHLEDELLRRPELPGFYTLTTSYRNEPNPIEGRHDLIFPMFEFELHGDMEALIKFEAGLLRHLGFPVPLEIRELDLNDPPEVQKQCTRGRWDDVAKLLQVDDIDAAAEKRISALFGPVFFLTDFPNTTSPFWNMKQDCCRPGYAKKVDVIIGVEGSGMETFGSAERSTDVPQMRSGFETVSNGGYANTLYSHFGHSRVDGERNVYYTHKFIERCGGGIGVTRLIKAYRELQAQNRLGKPARPVTLQDENTALKEELNALKLRLQRVYELVTA